VIRELTLSAGALRSLALDAVAAPALPTLASGQLSVRMLSLFGATEQRRPEGGRQADLTAAAALLHRASAADVLPMVLGAPETGLWMARRRAAAQDAGTWPGDPGSLVCALAAAAGIRARLDFELDVPLVDGVLVLPGLGCLPTDGGRRATVRSESGRWQVRLDGADEPTHGGWLRPIEVPLRCVPGPDRRADSVWHLRVHGGGHDVRTDRLWQLWHEPGAKAPEPGPRPADAEQTLRSAWELLVSRHESFATDLAACMTDIIALDSSKTAHSTSASSPDAYGAAWIDLARAPFQVAASLVHECQHSVLAALHDLLPLHAPDPRDVYPVPWHTRPRTINALLHGLFAHTAEAEFWHREARHGTGSAAARRDRLLGWCTEVVAAATGAQGLTQVGDLVVEGICLRLKELTRTAAAESRPQRPNARVMDTV
jgi:HEXXH motif-containing protein